MNKARIILAVVVLVVLGGIVSIAKLGRENKQLRTELETLKQDPQKIAKEETDRVAALVGKLAILPTDEEPVLATVTDKEQLKDQPVFAKAENGDKILIYSKAQKAYIYNPTKNILVDVVSVNIGNTTAITGVDANNPLRLALVNGTKTSGITSTLEQRIKDSKVLGISVTVKSIAKSLDYTKTLVLDLTGKWGTQAKELAAMLGGQVATQTAETKPGNADIMVIVGSDFK